MITVDIVTPTRKLVDGVKAESVKIPGYRGELMILPGHADLLTLLDTGVASFVQDGRERLFVLSHGFAEVRGNKVMIMAETAEESKDIDKVRALAAQKRAEEKLGGVLDESEFKKHQLKLQRAILRQHIAGA